MTMRPSFFLFAAVLLAALLGSSPKALALPAYSRQTGQECSSCHVGSFGPQLTAYGRDFKLNGYVWGGVQKRLKGFSAMVIAGFENTAKDLRKGIELTGAQENLNTNNNVSVDQTSLFYAGALASNLGIFSQATYSGPDRVLSWDNVDLRYADNTKLGGKDFVYGVTLNNNPSVQDVWQTVPAWMFPYVASGIAPAPDAGPYMGGLGQTVAGLGAYGLWNSLVYAELSGYKTLSDDVQQTMGMKDVATSDHLRGIAPYWRVALQHDSGQHYFSLGTFGMSANRLPGNLGGFGADNMLDTAVDATYQFASSDGKHSVSLYASALHERQDLAATFASGNSSASRDSLNSYNASASYYFRNIYGFTASRFVLTGSADALLYPDPANHRPDSAGWTFQIDATPFGTAQSFGYPNINARVFLQYTAYDKFNGLSKNYDGTGRNASDNNTLFLGTWLTF